MKIIEITETKKKTDVKWNVKLKDGKTKTVWAPTKYDAKQKLGTSILIQGGYTIKKASLDENASVGATSSGGIDTAPAGNGVAYGGGSTYGVGTQKKRKKKTTNEEEVEENLEDTVLRR